MDLSDGLASDARRLADASGVALALDAAALPVAPDVVAVAERLGVPAQELAATGGEDYELLVCAPPAARAAAEAAAGADVDRRGRRGPAGGRLAQRTGTARRTGGASSTR